LTSYKIPAHAFSTVTVLAHTLTHTYLQAEKMRYVREALAVCQRS